MLPYYTIFDNLAYRINGNSVILLGETTNAQDDAGRVVKRIEGVDEVKNNIDVLPPSPNDDRIRRQVARALFSTDGLEKYSMSALPPVHIIVKNGHVTLAGVVDTPMDKHLANTAASGVPEIFSVENDLQVADLLARNNWQTTDTRHDNVMPFVRERAVGIRVAICEPKGATAGSS
jgi:hyperosmotically inducible protein